MTKKPKSSQLWDIYFFVIGLISIIVCISIVVPGLLSAKSTMTNFGGMLLLGAVLLPLLLIYLGKLISAVRKLIETKRDERNSKCKNLFG